MRFFRDIKNSDLKIGVLGEVFLECKRDYRFYKILPLLSELEGHYGAYERIITTVQEKQMARQWENFLDDYGNRLDIPDRRIVAVAKSRSMPIFTNDKGVKTLALNQQVLLKAVVFHRFFLLLLSSFCAVLEWRQAVPHVFLQVCKCPVQRS